MSSPMPADLSSLHAIVPLHAPHSAKSRLGPALDAEEREALVVGMLAHVVDTLAAWPACRQIHVVSDDPVVAWLLGRAGRTVDAVTDPLGGDLNAALRAATDRAVSLGATAVLILPADVPLLNVESLEALLDAADAAVAAGGARPVVAIAPSDARRGTNALLLAPPGVIEPQFGEQSFESHLRAAAGADASVQVVDDPALGFDLDTPDDLERLDVARLLQLAQQGQSLLGPAAAPAPAR